MKHGRKDYQHIQDVTGKIGADEPVFILRAKDALAPATVRKWADELEAHNGDPSTIAQAREVAEDMEAWQQRTKLAQLPDVGTPKPVKPSVVVYSPTGRSLDSQVFVEGAEHPTEITGCIREVTVRLAATGDSYLRLELAAYRLLERVMWEHVQIGDSIEDAHDAYANAVVRAEGAYDAPEVIQAAKRLADEVRDVWVSARAMFKGNHQHPYSIEGAAFMLHRQLANFLMLVDSSNGVELPDVPENDIMHQNVRQWGDVGFIEQARWVLFETAKRFPGLLEGTSMQVAYFQSDEEAKAAGAAITGGGASA